MGKKGKKTRWRELPITLADKPYSGPTDHQQPFGRQSAATVGDSKPVNFAAAAGRRSHYAAQQQQPYNHHHRHQSSNDGHAATGQQHHHHTETSTVTFNEDEYTKITTPRQDVLFKKGYLGRRKHAAVPAAIAEVLNENEDGVPTDTIVSPLDELCAPNEYFVDSSGIYILNGSGYEVYDPYTGNFTVLMGPPPPYPPGPGHPMLAPISYQPMPLQPLDWYSPVNEHWMSGATAYQPNGSRYHHKKSITAATDHQQNCNSTVQNSETGANGAQDSCVGGDQQQNNLYQSPFVYPAGYIFGAPMYNNYNGANVQVPQLPSPPSPSISCSDYANGKRRKKKKRRKRGGVNDEYSDSSSEEQKSQSGASSDHVIDSEKTSDSGVLTNNSGGSTPVNVIPVQLSHSAPPFHMECAQPFEILHGTPFLVHPHHPDHQMAAYYQPIPQYHHHSVVAADHQLQQQAAIGYQVIPEEQSPADEVTDARQQDDAEPAAASYSAENSDSGISSPNSEVMVKGGHQPDGKLHEKPQAANGAGVASGQAAGATASAPTTAGATKKSRNKKSKQREKAAAAAESATVKAKTAAGKDSLQKNHHHHHHHHHEQGSKKSSKIAKEPAIIKKLNAAKKGKNHSCKQESEKSDATKLARECQPTALEADDDDDDDDDEVTREEIVHNGLSINPDAGDWIQEEVFCSLECTPRSTTTDHVQFKFTKTQSVDSCESVEEETFVTAVNTGNSDTENEIRQDEPPAPLPQTPQSSSGESADPGSSPGVTARAVHHSAPPPGPITEAVTKWLNDQGGLMLAPCLDDDDDDDDGGGGSDGVDDGDDDGDDYARSGIGDNDNSGDGDDDEDGDSEYDDFDEHPSSPKNARGNPYPALSLSGGDGSRVAGAQSSGDQRKGGIISSGICCLTQ
ncbi:Hypothetical protein CINCED_3A011498 [Cinara cedri]|uniref:Uncharacterized protein n=1 Tax=Cinara cedri TaxID=506608 RepID=A0A5E4MHK9_9HEMI|nr:Hypothetical protein CINCED_3A011498 [Cinara cedri]